MNDTPDIGLSDDQKKEINTLAAVIIAKVLDEVAPNSATVTASQVRLGSLACKWAGKQLEIHAHRLERGLEP